ncbi:MAG: hypothetical protein AB8H79_24140 [Myxococcota bacterium]
MRVAPDSLCRVWTGEVQIDDRGGVSVDEPSIAIANGLPATVTDVAMRARVDASAEAVAGFELGVTIDTRDFNSVLDSEEEGPADPGELRDLLEELATPIEACADGELECARFVSFAGAETPYGHGWTEHHLDAAKPCGGIESGSLSWSGPTCSVVGSAGIGLGMFGFLGLLFRRRRRRWPR